MTQFIMAIDAAYGETHAAAAGVLFADWGAADEITALHHAARVAADYEPGAFYKRELPLLEALVALSPHPPTALVVDGYVWLSGDARPGLGGHLFKALGESVPVIGVAKTRFRDDDWSAPITRGESAAPLYITAAGIALEVAARNVQRMHGAHRLPTHLKRADQLSRARLATIVS